MRQVGVWLGFSNVAHGELRRPRLTARRAVLLAAFGVLLALQGAGVAQASTAGEYTVAGLPSGTYRVGFFSFEESGNYLTQYYNGKTTFGEADNVGVSAPPTGGQISGRITAAAGGAPLTAAVACAEKVTGEVFEFFNCASTNSNGEYTISSLPSGEYVVLFFAFEGYEFQYYNGATEVKNATKIAVTPPNTVSGINAALVATAPPPESGSIAGRVTAEAGGAPLEHIVACTFSEETFAEGCAETNANGEYTIEGLTGGEYVVFFFPAFEEQNYVSEYYKDVLKEEEATPVPVVAHNTASGIDAKLKAGGQISGTVTAFPGGAPISGASVCAFGEEAGRCAVSKGNGEYTITGLATGEYTVNFFAEEYESATVKEVKAKAGETTSGVNAQLNSLGKISGRVVAAEGGAPLANISACANGRCGTTNANGEYVITGLASNVYTVFFEPVEEASNYISETAKATVTAPNVTENVNVALKSGGQITGVVTSAATGAGIAKVSVCVFKVIGEPFFRCGLTQAGTAVTPTPTPAPKPTPKPTPNSSFTMAKAAFNKKTGEIDFFFTVFNAGKFKWALVFKNADVAFADALGVENGIAEAAKKKKCKKGFIRHKRRCVHVTVPFGSGSQSVAGAGTVEIKVRPSAKALKALKAGRTLHVSGAFQLQSALGGSPVTHRVSLAVHKPAKHKKKKRH